MAKRPPGQAHGGKCGRLSGMLGRTFGQRGTGKISRILFAAGPGRPRWKRRGAVRPKRGPTQEATMTTPSKRARQPGTRPWNAFFGPERRGALGARVSVREASGVLKRGKGAAKESIRNGRRDARAAGNGGGASAPSQVQPRQDADEAGLVPQLAEARIDLDPQHAGVVPCQGTIQAVQAGLIVSGAGIQGRPETTTA